MREATKSFGLIYCKYSFVLICIISLITQFLLVRLACHSVWLAAAVGAGAGGALYAVSAYSVSAVQIPQGFSS